MRRTLWAECMTCGRQVRFVLPEDIDALHDEIEQLRAENAKLRKIIKRRPVTDATN